MKKIIFLVLVFLLISIQAQVSAYSLTELEQNKNIYVQYLDSKVSPTLKKYSVDKLETILDFIDINLVKFEETWDLKNISIFSAFRDLVYLQLEKKENEVLIVRAWDKVSVQYTWKFEDWEKFDSSLDRGEALEFEVWDGNIISWFELWVKGLSIWDKKTFIVLPSEAYGEYDDSMFEVVNKSDLSSFVEAGYSLEVWEKLPTMYGEFEIIGADDQTVTIDLNHPLAGKTLIFDVEILDIKRIAEEKWKLEVFLMSYCPFWEIAAKAIPDLKDTLGDSLSLDIHYIASKTWEWNSLKDFQSLHGVSEVEEDIRQVCIKNYYWIDILVDYMQKRYENANNYWQVTDDISLSYDYAWIDYEKIDTCVTNWEGAKLFEEDIKYTSSLGITASPTWIANNKYSFGWIEAESIKNQFCSHNEDLEACDIEIDSSNFWDIDPTCN